MIVFYANNITFWKYSMHIIYTTILQHIAIAI